MDLWGLAKEWGPTIVGGLLGGSEAGESQTTTTQTGAPAWALPYLQGIAQEGANLYGQGGGVAPFSPDTMNAFGQMRDLYNIPSYDQTGLQQLQSTASGAEMNPYLDRVTSSALDDVENRVNSQFSSAGRYGSGMHKQQLTRDLGDVSARMRMPLYEAERGRQMTAAQKLPFAQGQFLQNQAFAPQMGLGIGQQIEGKGQQMLDYPWTNLSRYSSLLQGIPFGQNQTQTIPGGSFTSGLLGGALVGNRIGDNLFNSNMA